MKFLEKQDFLILGSKSVVNGKQFKTGKYKNFYLKRFYFFPVSLELNSVVLGDKLEIKHEAFVKYDRYEIFSEILDQSLFSR